MRIPIFRSRAFKKRLRDELMKGNPYAALDRCCYQDCLLHNRVLEEEVSKGRVRKVKPRIWRRFAMRKIMLMKIDYQAKSIRITLKTRGISLNILEINMVRAQS